MSNTKRKSNKREEEKKKEMLRKIGTFSQLTTDLFILKERMEKIASSGIEKTEKEILLKIISKKIEKRKKNIAELFEIKKAVTIEMSYNLKPT